MNLRGFVAFAAVAIALVSAEAAFAAGGIAWKSDFGAAKAEAKKSHRLLFVDFYADW